MIRGDMNTGALILTGVLLVCGPVKVALADNCYSECQTSVIEAYFTQLAEIYRKGSTEADIDTLFGTQIAGQALLNVGWWVGWIEKGVDTYYFAFNMDIDREGMLSYRKTIPMKLMASLGLFVGD